jgi:hypothetical protein
VSISGIACQNLGSGAVTLEFDTYPDAFIGNCDLRIYKKFDFVDIEACNKVNEKGAK